MQDDNIGGTQLDWYDFIGRANYDPELGRFHSIDPLMEFHFDVTPYHYCFNNPINLIDPFGMDTLKVDPNSGLPTADIPGIVVVGHKPSFWERLWNFLTSDQTYGEPIVTTEGGADPATEKATITGPQINVDDLLPAIKGAGAGSFKAGPLNMAKAINKGGKVVTDIIKKTSDKEIKQATGDKTDAHGQPISETDNAQGQTTTPQGQESDSSVVQQGLYFTNDSVVVQDFKAKNNTSMGRVISQPYKIKHEKSINNK